ncbi:MAG: hypothetical protein H6737_06540 [Alphaproteobacteria bacterium]|nr:hypothetical protein [Alphaproteobacteria bacterium]
MFWLAALTGCAWITPEQLDEALQNADLGFTLVNAPMPATLATCSLPAETEVVVGFAPHLDGASAEVQVRYVNTLGIASEWSPLETLPLVANVADEVLAELSVPVPPERCDQGCEAFELLAVVGAGDAAVRETLNVPLLVGSVAPELLGATLGGAPLSEVVLSTEEPVGAVNVTEASDLALVLRAEGWASGISPALSPTVKACPDGVTPGDAACVSLTATTSDTGADRTYTASLASLADACQTGPAPVLSLYVTLDGSPCTHAPIDLGLAARFVVSDCDLDGVDALAWGGDDCNDSDATFSPARQGEDDDCDGEDQDCDGDADDDIGFWYADVDSDGYGDANAVQPPTCMPPPNHVQNSADCDDSDGDVYPSNVETVCDGIDNDCDSGTPDDSASGEWFTDADGDGLGAPGTGVMTDCPLPGQVANDGDCDDDDDDEPSMGWYPDDDSDGLGAYGAPAQTLCTGTPGFVQNDEDCDDADVDPTLVVLTLYPDGDGDGLGYGGSQRSCIDLPQTAPNGWDCDDSGVTLQSQNTRGAILADGGTYDADTFDWSTLDGFANVQLCADTTGTMVVPEIVLETPDLLLRSGNAVPVTLAPAGTHRLIRQNGGTLVAETLALVGGDAGSGRGGCLQSSGILQLSDVSFTDCVTNGRGGALDLVDAALFGVRVEGSVSLVGAVHVTPGGSVTIVDGSFVDNTAGSGAALGCDSCTVSIMGAELAGNVANDAGGAIWMGGPDTELTVQSSTFRNNVGIAGGAIAIEGSSQPGQAAILSITASTFDGNATSSSGGGHLWAIQTTTTITGSTFEKGYADQGGAIEASGPESSLTVSDSTFEDNESVGSGGALWLDDTLFEARCPDLALCPIDAIDGVRFAENVAGGSGGAIHTTGSLPTTVTGAVFEANTAGSGGAIWFIDNQPLGALESTVENTRFHLNTATEGSAFSTGGGSASSPAILHLTSVTITTSGGAGSTIYGNDVGSNTSTELVYTDLVLSDLGTPQFDLRFQGVAPPNDILVLTTLSGSCSQSADTAPVCVP